MKLQRPQYLMAGIILLILGIQCLYVDSYILTAQTSAVLSSQLDIAPAHVDNSTTSAKEPDATDNNLEPPTLTGSEEGKQTRSSNQNKTSDFSGKYTLILPDWLTWAFLGASGICFLRAIPWLARRKE